MKLNRAVTQSGSCLRDVIGRCANRAGARRPAMSVTPTNTSPFIEGAKPSSVTISWGAFYGQLALCLVG